MESPTIQEGDLVVAREDSSPVEQRDLSTTSTKPKPAGETVPTVANERTMDEKSMQHETVVKFNEPDFTYLEISSRLERAGSSKDSTTSSGDSRTAGCSFGRTDSVSCCPEGRYPEDRRYDPSTRNFAGNKTLDDMDCPLYDENLFGDEILQTSSSESTPSRKRQIPDFLPISAEIKRIGVEISEEHAKQLKNDVRRLSPVLVSLRERTLGEISLTSDSGLFEGGDQAQRLRMNDERTSEASMESSDAPEQLSPPVPECLPKITSAREETPLDEKCENSASNEMDNRSPLTDPRIIESATDDKSASERLRESGHSESPNSPLASSDFAASSTSSPRSNAQRELMIVLSRVDCESPEPSTRTRLTTTDPTNNGDGSGRREDGSLDVAEDKTAGDGILEPSMASVVTESIATTENCRIAEERDEIVNKNEEVAAFGDPSGKIDRAVISADCALSVDDIRLSPKFRDNDQLRRKSPKVVLERTLQDSTSPRAERKNEHDDDDNESRGNLDCVRRTLAESLDDRESEEEEEEAVLSSDPLAINDNAPGSTGSDRINLLQESLDTETETETASDNSEIVSVTSIQSRDRAESINDGSTCPETDSGVSDERTRRIMTRLQPEGPEAFTEDSAESLALTTGARDEVRSDGSDSGLGSEIPGEPGTVPAPESDSETSFLDRIPDDILSDKDKAVNPLEAFVADAGTSGIQAEHQEISQPQQLPLLSFPSPPKSSLKRRLTDCMEGEPSPKRINTDDQMRKKRNIQFDAVTVYYFPRAQGFTCVPSQGGSTLGMSSTHTHAERFSLTEHAAEQRRLHRARLAQLRSERAANCVTEAASSSEDPSDDTDEEPSDTEELDIDSYYFLQPVPTWQRRALLRAAGVRRIDAIEKDDCRDIRASREHCGCGCKGYCDPESCPCSRANVKCQVDRAGFPCGCSRDGCANTSGRIEFNPVRVRTHFIHTLMRLQLEKKQRDEDCTDHDLLANNQMGRGPIREIPTVMGNPLGPMDHQNPMAADAASCMNVGGFTTLHYETHDPTSASCPTGVVHAAREDSLDLYAIRDDYPANDADGGPSSQRKLHPEFGQVFQAFPGQQPAVTFPQSAYQDYQSYQALASTSRSQFQPHFQNVTTANPAFNQYSYGQETMHSTCQSHQPVSEHHSSVYETTSFPHEDSTGGSQYTNLNSVQPMNAVVQQMGKLEPFSELLASRYSYYGDPEPQPVPVVYHSNAGQKIESDKAHIDEQQSVQADTDDCDENFGEIIKKSMVETVSA